MLAKVVMGRMGGWLANPVRVALPRLGLALALIALTQSCSHVPEPEFATPECCCYDERNDLYLVSNVHGAPLDKDGNGFILRVSPTDGARSMWISGEQTGVTLHAPKGMAISGDVLWVADIDVLRKFHRNTGAPMGEVAIAGATFLNDVSVGPDGSIYCSDSGLDSKFEATGTDAIWRIAPDGAVSPLIQGVDLGQPNGLSAQPGGVYVVSWRDGTFYQVDYRGARTDLATAPQKQLDGLVRVPGSRSEQGATGPVWFTTSWQGSTVYRISLTGGVTAMALRLQQAADLTYDSKRNCLVVPLFGENRLHIERL